MIFMKVLFVLIFFVQISSLFSQEARKYISINLNNSLNDSFGIPLGIERRWNLYLKQRDTTIMQIDEIVCDILYNSNDTISVSCSGDSLAIVGQLLIPPIKSRALATVIRSDSSGLNLISTVRPYEYYEATRIGIWKVKKGNEEKEKAYDMLFSPDVFQKHGEGEFKTPYEYDEVTEEELKMMMEGDF